MSLAAKSRSFLRWGLVSAFAFATAILAADQYVSNEGAVARRIARSAQSFDVALVPGCFAGGSHPAPVLAARLDAALDLYHHGRVRQILVTGDENAGETSAMVHWLAARGVPVRDILVDGMGRRTLESAQRAAQVYGVQSAVVCTQPLHMARTLFLLREAGIDATGTSVARDLGSSARWRAVEAFKRAVAFTEVRLLRKLEQPPATVAMH